MVAAENSARSPRATPEAPGGEETEKSREDIAASLASKDPSWFRQTADRGVGSAAYRRSQVEDPAVTEFISGQRGLPGISRDFRGAAESSRSPPPDDLRPSSPSRTNSVRNSAAFNMSTNKFSMASSGPDSKSPLDAPTLNPSDASSRIAARSPSPTKGMGGFVQSAMLKRSDSVNKRWSAQAAPGLSRQNSTASNRGGFRDAGLGSASMPRLDSRTSTNPSRGNSTEPGSRPTSSHANNSFSQLGENQTVNTDEDGFTRPTLPLHARSKSVASLRSVQSTDNESAQPPSPSKRWSPTKSSWLESALNKPEDKPKLTSPPPSSQPAWLSDLNKAKQQRSNTSVEKPPPVTEAETPKPAYKSTEAKSPPPEPAAKPASLVKEQSDSSPLRSTKSPSPITTPKPAPKPDFNKPAELGKFDFRANLKSRQAPSDGNKSEEPEFKNALGKLKRTQTQKYEIPDEFKNNILRGKAALNVTGGPAPRQRVDELKESLVKRKAEMQAKAAVEGPKKPIEKPEASTPEALAKRKFMGKDETFQDPLEKPKEHESSTPEALLRFRSVKEKVKPEFPQKPTSPPLTRKDTPATEGVMQKEETPSKTVVSQTPSNQDAPSRVNLFAGGLKPGASNKLADRFNPALAGMIARGRSPMGNKSGSGGPATTGDASDPPKAQTVEEPGPGRELTHMTKGRARGPKRKSPSSKPTESASSSEPLLEVEKKPPAKVADLPKLPLVKPQNVLPSNPKDGEFKSRTVEEYTTPAKAKPVTPSKSARLSQLTSSKSDEAENLQPEDAAAPLKAQLSGDRSPLQDQDLPKQHRRVTSRSSPIKDRSSPITSPRSEPLAIHEDDVTKRESMASIVSPKSSSSRWSKPTESSETSSTSAPSRPLSTTSGKQSAAPLGSPEISKKVSEDMSTNEPKKTPGEPSKKPSALWGSLGNLQRADTLDMTPELSRRRPESPVKSRSPERQEDDLSNVSVKNATAFWGRTGKPASSSTGPPKSPVKLPTRADEEKAMRDAGLMPPPDKLVGLGLGVSGNANTTRSPINLPLSPPLSAGLPKKPDTSTVADTSKENGTPSKRTSTIKSPSSSSLQPPSESPRPTTPQTHSRAASTSSKPPPESPIPHTSEANRLFTDFFDDRPSLASLPDIDTLAILQHEPLAFDKITTIRKTMQVVLGNGQLSTVPPHQEHIVYDDSMYICTHQFSTATGSRATEVYLWCGSGVPPAAVEDAQLFARKAAKEHHNARFEILQQGKETPNFLQAIGGNLITFRGSAMRTAAAVPETFVLCGRRHVGQITFDEVDFSLGSFCSAFPYIVSKDGKLYLWKGVGCHSEELGCALLIAMDLGMGPEGQIREGEEPESFLRLFPSSSTPGRHGIPRSADHWKLKPRCDKYRCRLFRVGQPGRDSSRSSLQVSSFLGSVTDSIRSKRSWQSMLPLPGSHSPGKEIGSPTNTGSRPQTPTTGAPNGGVAGGGKNDAPVVTEIAPFTQADLRPEDVYVLDAFFEIYVYVPHSSAYVSQHRLTGCSRLIGSAAQSQSRAFATALLFAQDYGILAASMEDRPFVPVSTVVLEGAPRDMKACFRQWKDLEENGSRGTASNKAGGANSVGRRVGSLRCVGLAAALAAARMENEG